VPPSTPSNANSRETTTKSGESGTNWGEVSKVAKGGYYIYLAVAVIAGLVVWFIRALALAVIGAVVFGVVGSIWGPGGAGIGALLGFAGGFYAATEEFFKKPGAEKKPGD
jgi:hypothetical protein